MFGDEKHNVCFKQALYRRERLKVITHNRPLNTIEYFNTAPDNLTTCHIIQACFNLHSFTLSSKNISGYHQSLPIFSAALHSSIPIAYENNIKIVSRLGTMESATTPRSPTTRRAKTIPTSLTWRTPERLMSRRKSSSKSGYNCLIQGKDHFQNYRSFHRFAFFAARAFYCVC